MNRKKDPFEQAQLIANKWYFIKKNITQNDSSKLSYYKYRILRPILKLYFRFFRLLNRPSPWLSPACSLILKNYLNRQMIGFEFGSGLSTIFLSKHIGRLISIEHYHPWYERVSLIIAKKNITNVELLLTEAQKIKEIPVNPTKSERKEIMYGNSYFNYTEYVNTINQVEDSTLDLLLVDGRERMKCLKLGIPKVKSGGIIILDNSERAHYSDAEDWLREYPKIFTTTGLTDTIIWFKN